MADSSVKFKIFGDADDATRAIVALEKKYGDLENKIRATGRASRQANGAALQELGALVSQYATLGAAVSVVATGYRQWTADVDRLTGALGKANSELRTQLSLSADVASGQEIKKFVQNIPGLTQAAGQGLFGAVTGAAPELPLSRRQALTADASRLVLAAGQQRAEQVAGLSADLGTQLTGKSAAELTNLAFAVQSQLGERAAETNAPGFEKALGLLVNGGARPEQALGLMVNAMQNGLEPKALSSMASKLDPARGVTLDALFADPSRARKVLGAQGAANFGLLNAGTVANLEAQFVGAQQNDMVGRVFQQALAVDPAGIERQLAAAGEERALRGTATRMDALGAGQAAQLAGASNPFVRWGIHVNQFAESAAAYTGFSELPEWAQFGVGASMGLPGSVNLAMGSMLRNIGQSSAALQSGGSQRAEQLAAAQLAELQRLNATLDQQRPAVNRQAHVEGN